MPSTDRWLVRSLADGRVLAGPFTSKADAEDAQERYERLSVPVTWLDLIPGGHADA